ncbi:MAG: alpha/beta hydrolase [Rhodothermales bacterium]|nr:alpha/beta hydrolase [Rhodothermales bacterium]
MIRVTLTVLLLCSVFCLPAIAQEPSSVPPEGLVGRWAGASIEAGTPTLLELRFSITNEAELQTELTLPYNGFDHFAYDFNYADGEYDGILTAGLFGDEMRLVVDLAEGHLRGTVTSDDSVTARVHLQRVIDYELPRSVAQEVRFQAGKDTLAGTLLLPEGVTNPPVAVLVTGRGYGTRVEMSLWGRLLARSGVAALTFDARGRGRSTGDNGSATAEDRLEDVYGALDFLADRSDVGPIGLLGNSAAGWILPNVAADRNDVAFVITLVAPAESLADQQGHVTTEFMRASGESFTREEYSKAFEYQRLTVVLAQRDATWREFERINVPAREARWQEHALIPDSLSNSDLDYFRRRRGFTAPAWNRVRVPVLAVYGETDLIVPPEINVPLLRSALSENEDVTVLVLPGANHTLARPEAVVGEGAWPDRFFRPWNRSAVLYETLTAWITERFVAP